MQEKTSKEPLAEIIKKREQMAQPMLSSFSYFLFPHTAVDYNRRTTHMN